jgi:hypothetical protein
MTSLGSTWDQVEINFPVGMLLKKNPLFQINWCARVSSRVQGTVVVIKPEDQSIHPVKLSSLLSRHLGSTWQTYPNIDYKRDYHSVYYIDDGLCTTVAVVNLNSPHPLFKLYTIIIEALFEEEETVSRQPFSCRHLDCWTDARNHITRVELQLQYLTILYTVS